uniref:Uncharacterized protein n=1 Tax=Geospiza parvula TaxID=87175 RepID=A0A8C3NI55_GEOPR
MPILPKYFILEVSNRKISKEEVHGKSRKTENLFLLISVLLAPTIFGRKLGSPLTRRLKLNIVSLTCLVFFCLCYWVLLVFVGFFWFFWVFLFCFVFVGFLFCFVLVFVVVVVVLVFFCRDCWSLKMEETRKLSPKLSKSKEPVKTEWGSQSVVFTYFQGDINRMVDEHFSRALSNVKNPQDLSTTHRDSMSPHQWDFSSHCYKPYPSSSSTSIATSALNFSAAGVVGPCQPLPLRSRPAQPADLWPFPPAGTPSVTGSVYPHTLPDLHAADELISDRKYSSLLGLLQQERCLTSMQECTMKQHSSSACMTGPARLQNMSQSSAPGGGIQIHERRRDFYF